MDKKFKQIIPTDSFLTYNTVEQMRRLSEKGEPYPVLVALRNGEVGGAFFVLGKLIDVAYGPKIGEQSVFLPNYTEEGVDLVPILYILVEVGEWSKVGDVISLKRYMVSPEEVLLPDAFDTRPSLVCEYKSYWNSVITK